MKAAIKTTLRVIIFFSLFNFILTHITGYFIRKDDITNEIHTFYSEAENTIDVLYLGSSPFLRGISPMTMYDKYGFTGYVRASALQAPSVTFGLLSESLEVQSPSLVVIYSDYIFHEYDYSEREGAMRISMDGMKNSIHKLRIAKEVVECDENQLVVSYLFPIFRYHDRWKEFKLYETEHITLLEHSYKKGHMYLRSTTKQEFPENFMKPSDNPAPAFNENAKTYIEKMIKLCKEKNIPVLLLHMPKMSWTYEESLAIENFAEYMNVDYLDLDKEEYRLKIGLDPETEYYDKGHMNLNGSIKLSEWLGGYLKEKYSLPEHKNDMWNIDLQKYNEAL